MPPPSFEAKEWSDKKYEPSIFPTSNVEQICISAYPSKNVYSKSTLELRFFHFPIDFRFGSNFMYPPPLSQKNTSKCPKTLSFEIVIFCPMDCRGLKVPLRQFYLPNHKKMTILGKEVSA